MNIMSEQELETMIQERGLIAPRLTPEKIDNQIKYCEYWVVPNTTTTVCAMILQNNFVVIGKSAAAYLANFDEEIGKQIAYQNARDQIWQLEGYVLKNTIMEAVL